MCEEEDIDTSCKVYYNIVWDIELKDYFLFIKKFNQETGTSYVTQYYKINKIKFTQYKILIKFILVKVFFFIKIVSIIFFHLKLLVKYLTTIF